MLARPLRGTRAFRRSDRPSVVAFVVGGDKSIMREDDDKALRSFREEPSARDLDKENSPYTAEVAPSPAESPAYYGSGYSTPRMRSGRVSRTSSPR